MSDGELIEQVKTAILERIIQTDPSRPSPNQVLQLAEAYAWITTPNNAHGGGSSSS